MRLENKVALITGAGRGIGRAAAELFAREGARLALAEKNEDVGREVEAALRGAGAEALLVPTDVSQSQDVQTLFAAVRENFGTLDVLYNNASVFLGADDKPIAELSEEVWQRVLAVNLNSVFLCCKYGLPLMLERGGSIINTASSAALIGVPGCDAYTASKGATLALTRSMAVEYGPHQVRVNCIAPAGINTPMLRESNLDQSGFDEAKFFAKAPLGRYGTAEEIAGVALFLASDESSYLTGAVLVADGGTTITPII
jgi:NAD(P)-dependent dehydrogenase (short-subunit alcohol dehydrogenase family)